jgi:hypothetical protein
MPRIPLTQRDSRPRTQAEQDKIEAFNAHRRLKLPSISYRILGPNERLLLRFEEEDLQVTEKGQFEPYQLQEFQKKKPKKHKRPRKLKEEKVPQVRTRYTVSVSEHLETIFGIPIPLI